MKLQLWLCCGGLLLLLTSAIARVGGMTPHRTTTFPSPTNSSTLSPGPHSTNEPWLSRWLNPDLPKGDQVRMRTLEGTSQDAGAVSQSFRPSRNPEVRDRQPGGKSSPRVAHQAHIAVSSAVVAMSVVTAVWTVLTGSNELAGKSASELCAMLQGKSTVHLFNFVCKNADGKFQQWTGLNGPCHRAGLNAQYHWTGLLLQQCNSHHTPFRFLCWFISVSVSFILWEMPMKKFQHHTGLNGPCRRAGLSVWCHRAGPGLCCGNADPPHPLLLLVLVLFFFHFVVKML